MNFGILRKLLVLTSALFAVIGVSAQSIRFELNAPTVIEAGTSFRVEFTLDAKPDDFTPPSFSGANIIAGPSVSHGQSMTVVNGKTTRSVSYTYTYLLQAGSEGKITIGQASVAVDGKTYSTRAATIDVVPGGATPAQPQAQSSNNQGGSASQQGQNQPATSVGKDDIQLRVSASASSVYKGEPIKVIFKLYTRVDIGGVENAKYPAFNGFWTQEINSDNYQWQRETLDGKVFSSRILREYIVFPQQSGTLEIEQMSMSILARIVTQSRRQSLFDDFFGGGQSIQEVSKNVASKPLKINVKDLPAGAPASFNGAVGRFTMDASLSAASLSANSSGSYDIKISGTGNLPLINAPKVEMPGSFEQYTLKSTDNFSVSGGNISGSKSYSIPFIPRAEGEYTIAGVEFSYFDPQSGKYTTLVSRENRITITPDNGGGAATGLITGVSKEDLKILGNEIRFIRIGNPELQRAGYVFLWSWQYAAILALIVILFVISLIYMQKRIRFRSNATLVRNKRAHKIALKRLKAAERNMSAGNKKEFFEEMLKAMWGYMSDKLNIPAAELSRDNIRGKMASKGIDDALTGKYIDLISECEFAQYAPAAETRIEEIYKAAVELFSNIESK